MMMKHLLLFGFLLLNLTIYGQIELRGNLGDVYYSADLYKTKYNSPGGSPYLNENFTPAKINDISITKLVRFDAFESRVEIMVDDNKVVILPDSEPYTITLLDGSDKVFITKGYIDEKGIAKTSFFELIANNENYRLYLKEEIKFEKAVKEQGYQEGKPAMFKKQKETYYISDIKGHSDQLLKIPYKSKNFLELFPDHSKKLKTFIKENKLKIDKGDDLIEIFEFYFNKK